jgi:hypothetical protein
MIFALSLSKMIISAVFVGCFRRTATAEILKQGNAGDADCTHGTPSKFCHDIPHPNGAERRSSDLSTRLLAAQLHTAFCIECILGGRCRASSSKKSLRLDVD